MSTSHKYINKVVTFLVSRTIDGNYYIPIIKPSKDQEAYCNRKEWHSIILQAVCDDKKCFIDVYCGESFEKVQFIQQNF
ncbi:hypothetical protein PPYR_02072 [Photinus pyralis]|uniref:Uncharacterized protein n=1 Tax=Photinus pyralis TaxID=7054 RepID=A0A5N4B673_PHOPY|nr:hypothetical protein PPYR_02072 [Photinus pyralis]